MPDVMLGQRVVRLHSDRGTEYQGSSFEARLKERNIFHTTIVGYDPQANGVAERYVGIIKEWVRKLLIPLS